MSNPSLPLGAILLAQQFHPRHKLSIPDVCPVLGLSRDGLYKRIRTGTIGLRIRKDELGKQWVLLSDLISYLFPETESMTAMPSGMPEITVEKRKRGRPRKAVTSNSDYQEGGAR